MHFNSTTKARWAQLDHGLIGRGLTQHTGNHRCNRRCSKCYSFGNAGLLRVRQLADIKGAAHTFIPSVNSLTRRKHPGTWPRIMRGR